MKYVENGGDVRSTSANAAYIGVVFQGTLDDALAQAKAAPDHGVPELNGRLELLAFLRVKLEAQVFFHPWVIDDTDADDERNTLIPADPNPKQSIYSLEYAMARWPSNFVSTTEAKQSSSGAEHG